jgi:hypothetical protein
MNKDAGSPSSPPNAGGGPTQSSKTLADMLAYFNTPSLRSELEDFRIRFESQFGETDLTKRYTSLWPPKQQEWLLINFPKRYFQGLPAFVQAFFKEKMLAAHRQGRLDDAPASLLRLYLSGQMAVEGDRWTR